MAIALKNSSPTITVIAPARLHMGFIDLSGSLGRHFGSIGIALNEINTTVSLSSAPEFMRSGAASERANHCFKQLCDELKVSNQLHLHIEQVIPEHVGLGSGTQMSLAIGMALSAFYNLDLTVRDIALLTARGARSGIGIAMFEQGGLVVDGGRGEQTLTPPVISRMPIPESWHFILVLDTRGQGLHGEDEIAAFKALPPFPQQQAAQLCYLLMMQALPAVAENNIQLFGEVITQLQQSVGEHFAAAQGGIFTSAEVADAMTFLQQHGATAIGQTSWGPTGFCAVEGYEQANHLKVKVEQAFTQHEHLQVLVVSARNGGGEVIIHTDGS